MPPSVWECLYSSLVVEISNAYDVPFLVELLGSEGVRRTLRLLVIVK